MSEKTIKFCDVCETEKKTVNHWWTVGINEGVFFSFMHTPNPSNLPERFEVPLGSKLGDACGREHAMTLYNRFLSYGSFNEEKAT